KNTVVRGGAGVFFAHPFDRGAPNSASLGYEKSATLNSPDNGVTAPFYLRDGVPALALSGAAHDASFGAVKVGGAATTAVTFFEQNRRTGYSEQFNLGVQQELPRNMVFEISYVGNLSRKLPSGNISINQVTPDKLAAARATGVAPTQKDRPFPQFSGVMLLAPAFGISNYHALVLRGEKRFAAGFNLLTTYTWSKFLNDVDEGGNSLGNEPPYNNYYDRKVDYGPSANDVRHRFTLSSVYELPFGRGKRYLSKSKAGLLFGNWSASVVAQLQSGPPTTV